MQKQPFLAQIVVSTKKHILRDFMIISKKLPPELALERCVKKAELIRRLGYFISLSKVLGFYKSNETYDKVDGTKNHEKFHRMCAERKLSNNMIEESSAYAYESFLTSNGYETNTSNFTKFGILSVRILHSIDHRKPILVKSISEEIKKKSPEIIMADNITAGLGIASDFIVYLECLEILRKFGTIKGVGLLFDAQRRSNEKGINEAKQFMIEKLGKRIAGKLEDRYEIDGPIKIRPIYHHTAQFHEHNW